MRSKVLFISTELDKYATLKRNTKILDTPIEIAENAQGNVILKGLQEQPINSLKDLALLYETAVLSYFILD